MLLLPLLSLSLSTFDFHVNSVLLQQIYISKLNYCITYVTQLGSSKSEGIWGMVSICSVKLVWEKKNK